jgi:hypothetical protein
MTADVAGCRVCADTGPQRGGIDQRTDDVDAGLDAEHEKARDECCGEQRSCVKACHQQIVVVRVPASLFV